MVTAQSKEMFDRNLAMFRDREPALYDQLKDVRPETSLVTTPSGEVDLSVGGGLLFGGRHDAAIDEILEHFWRAPTRIQLTPPSPDQGDDEAGRFIADLLWRCEDAGVRFGDRLQPTDSYFLLLFGVGLGAHIDRMVERSGCRTLVLVEPELELFHHSLATHDWVSLYRSFDASGRTLRLVCGLDASNSCMAIKWLCRESNVCALDGTYYMKLYDTPVIQEILSRLGNELMGVSEDLGCYLDERLMVRNAYANLRHGGARIYHTPSERKLDTPVFLVGSGPSLDDAIAVIKENQDRAVIVSVGTAVQPLLNNGIVPDFQVESENYYPDFDEIHEFLRGAPETEQIHLVAAVTCPEEFVKSYGAATLYFRAAQTPAHLFKPPDSATLIGGSPAVGNAGFSFIQWAGFRTFYLFGMDMGARDPERHHAEGSMGLVLEDFNVEVPGNFGGTVLTTTLFFKMLGAIQEAVWAFSDGREYFNCSDGCAVRGVQPLRPGEVTLEPPKTDKSETIERLINDSEEYDLSQVEARLREHDLVARVSELTEEAAGIVGGASSFAENDHLARLYELFTQETDPERTPARMIIRGSIFNILIATRYFSNRLADRGQDPLFRDAVQGLFIEAMERLNQRCASDLDYLAGNS